MTMWTLNEHARQLVYLVKDLIAIVNGSLEPGGPAWIRPGIPGGLLSRPVSSYPHLSTMDFYG